MLARSLDRRHLLLGLTALAAPARAQDVVDPPSRIRLVSNLLTRMALPVRINGRDGGLFVLDTGAGRTILSQELAHTLGLPPAREVLVHGLTAAQPASAVRLSRCQVGGQRFVDLETPVFPRGILGADGLLGLDVLGRFRLELRIDRREVNLTPVGGEIMLEGSASDTPTRLGRRLRTARRGRFGQLIFTRASVDGIAVDAFVDTGAQHSIGNLALARAQRAVAATAPVTIYGVTGQMAAASVSQASDIRLAGRKLGAGAMMFADLHAFRMLGLSERPALLVGADLLYRFRRITLDYGHSRMSFGGLRPPD